MFADFILGQANHGEPAPFVGPRLLIHERNVSLFFEKRKPRLLESREEEEGIRSLNHRNFLETILSLILARYDAIGRRYVIESRFRNRRTILLLLHERSVRRRMIDGSTNRWPHVSRNGNALTRNTASPRSNADVILSLPPLPAHFSPFFLLFPVFGAGSTFVSRLLDNSASSRHTAPSLNR